MALRLPLRHSDGQSLSNAYYSADDHERHTELALTRGDDA